MMDDDYGFMMPPDDNSFDGDEVPSLGGDEGNHSPIETSDSSVDLLRDISNGDSSTDSGQEDVFRGDVPHNHGPDELFDGVLNAHDDAAEARNWDGEINQVLWAIAENADPLHRLSLSFLGSQIAGIPGIDADIDGILRECIDNGIIVEAPRTSGRGEVPYYIIRSRIDNPHPIDLESALMFKKRFGILIAIASLNTEPFTKAALKKQMMVPRRKWLEDTGMQFLSTMASSASSV